MQSLSDFLALVGCVVMLAGSVYAALTAKLWPSLGPFVMEFEKGDTVEFLDRKRPRVAASTLGDHAVNTQYIDVTKDDLVFHDMTSKVQLTRDYLISDDAVHLWKSKAKAHDDEFTVTHDDDDTPDQSNDPRHCDCGWHCCKCDALRSAPDRQSDVEQRWKPGLPCTVIHPIDESMADRLLTDIPKTFVNEWQGKPWKPGIEPAEIKVPRGAKLLEPAADFYVDRLAAEPWGIDESEPESYEPLELPPIVMTWEDGHTEQRTVYDLLRQARRIGNTMCWPVSITCDIDLERSIGNEADRDQLRRVFAAGHVSSNDATGEAA